MSEFNKVRPGIYKALSLEGLWAALDDYNDGACAQSDNVRFIGGVPKTYPQMVEFHRRESDPSVGQKITVEPLTMNGLRNSTCVDTFKAHDSFYFTAFSQDGLKDALHYYLRDIRCADVEFVLGPVSEIQFPSDFQITSGVSGGIRRFIAVQCAGQDKSNYYLRIPKPQQIPGASFLGGNFYLVFNAEGIRSSYYHFCAHTPCSGSAGPQDVVALPFPMLVNYSVEGDADFVHHAISLPADFTDVLDLMSTKIVNQSKV